MNNLVVHHNTVDIFIINLGFMQLKKKQVARSAKLSKARYSWQALLCLVLLFKCITRIIFSHCYNFI